MKALVLGGIGAYGTYVVDALVKSSELDVVGVGCRDIERGARLAAALGATIELQQLDICNEESLRRSVASCDVVVNAAGPSYLVGPPALRAAISESVHYVDICDDARSAQELLALDDAARVAGITAVIGCGCSPGMTNLAAKSAAQGLDRIESIDVMLAGGEGRPVAGPANVLHLLDLVHGSIPIVRDGELTTAAGFSELEQYDFGDPLGTVTCGLIAHPEPLMFLRSFPGLRRASAKLGVGSEALGDLLRACAELGLTSEEPVQVGESLVSPREVIANHLYTHLEFENDQYFEGPGSPTAVHVVVDGVSAGSSRRVVYRLYADIGPLVGIAAAVAAISIGVGRVGRPGVHLPDELFDAAEFVADLASRGGPTMEVVT